MGGGAEAEPTLQPGARVDHFRIRHLIGRGGMGEVYLARDTRLGRKVALKVLHRTRGAASLEAFLDEARLTARLNHPHIVAVYDVGEHQGLPYAALEYLEGRTLRQVLRQERVSVRHALRVAHAMAQALEAAHRAGVLHRDLKPENVLLPADGRVRVVDFGLARSVESGPEVSVDGSLSGTPAYMAPEQWLRGETSPASDVWALGLCLHEMLCGAHPFGQLVEVSRLRAEVCREAPVPGLPNAEGLPAQLVELVSRCVDKDPEQRPMAGAVVRALERALWGDGERAPEDGPFRGLLPFAEEHARFFFGREAEVGLMVERLRGQATLPVVGPSGSGKSSVVFAGVVPRLREQAYWLVLSLRPGRDPFGALASRLQVVDSSHGSASDPTSPLAGATFPLFADDLSDELTTTPAEPLAPPSRRSVAQLVEQLRASPMRLHLVLHELAEECRCRVLLVVDQLEELFTLVDDEAERLAFLAAICTAADDPAEPIRVVFTVREDFLGRLATSPEAARALERVAVLRPMERAGLEQAIRGPLAAVGYRLDEPTVVDEMLDEVHAEPGGLPLLQFAARALWDRRDRALRLVRAEAYLAIGGVAGALARHADDVLAGLGSTQLLVARQLLLRLVTPEGTRAVMGQAEAVAGLEPVAAEVLERLVQSRLVAIRQLEGDAHEVELVHESLVRSWSRLARWLDESREEVRVRAEVEEAARTWSRRGRRSTDLWRGDTLADAHRVVRLGGMGLSEQGRAFLDAGVHLQGRTARQRRRLVIAGGCGLTLLAAGSILAAVEYAGQERQARRLVEQAEDAHAAALVAGARAAWASGQVLQARAQLRTSLDVRDSTEARALWWALRQEPRVWTRSLHADADAVGVSADGGTLVLAYHRGVLRVIDARSATDRVVRLGDRTPVAVAVAPDGLVVAEAGGRVARWSLVGGQLEVLADAPVGIAELHLLPDGCLLGFGRDADLVSWLHLWPADPGGEPLTLPGRPRHYRLAISGDGRWAATAPIHGGQLVLWDLSDQEPPRELGEIEQLLRLGALCFSPDGQALAALGKWNRVFDLTGAAEPRTFPGHGHFVVTGGWVGDSTLAGIDRQGEVRLWDAATGQLERAWASGLDGAYRGVAGHRLAVLHKGGVGLVDLEVLAASDQARGHEHFVNAVDVDPANERVASVANDGTVRVWDLETSDPIRTLDLEGNVPNDVRFDPSGILLASAHEHDVYLWHADNFGQVATLSHVRAVLGLDFTPDGRALYTADWGGRLRRWDLSPLAGLNERVDIARRDITADWYTSARVNLFSTAVSPDGRWLASGGHQGLLEVWDRASGRSRELEGHEDGVIDLSFAGDGRLLTNSYDGRVRLWDLETGEVVREWDDGHALARVAISPDGRTVAYPTEEAIHLVDLPTDQVRALRGHYWAALAVDFSADGQVLVSGGDEGSVRAWDVATGHPLWFTALLVDEPSALLTHRGWTPLDGRAPEGEWAQAVQSQALRGDVRGPVLCALTRAGTLQRWDLSTGRQVAEIEVPGDAEVVATSQSCAFLVDGAVRLLAGDGSVGSTDLLGPFAHLHPTATGFATVAEGQVTTWGAAGELERRVAVDGSPSAAWSDASGLAVGLDDG